MDGSFVRVLKVCYDVDTEQDLGDGTDIVVHVGKCSTFSHGSPRQFLIVTDLETSDEQVTSAYVRRSAVNELIKLRKRRVTFTKKKMDSFKLNQKCKTDFGWRSVFAFPKKKIGTVLFPFLLLVLLLALQHAVRANIERVEDPVLINGFRVPHQKEWLPWAMNLGNNDLTTQVKTVDNLVNPEMRFLEPGNHFIIKRQQYLRSLGIEHHFLIVAVNATPKNVSTKIIHMTKRQHTGYIEEKEMVFELTDSGWEMTTYPSSGYVNDLKDGRWGLVVDATYLRIERDPAHRVNVIHNAKRIMEEGRYYSTLFYNCESFIMEAKYGVPRTRQAEKGVANLIKILVCIIALRFSCHFILLVAEIVLYILKLHNSLINLVF